MLAFSGVVTVWGVNTSKIVAVRGYYFRRLLFRGLLRYGELILPRLLLSGDTTFRGCYFGGSRYFWKFMLLLSGVISFGV